MGLKWVFPWVPGWPHLGLTILGYVGSIYVGTTSVEPPWNLLTNPLGTTFSPYGAFMETFAGLLPSFRL